MSDIVNVLPYHVDLDAPIAKTHIGTLFATDDSLAHRFVLTIAHGGEAVDLTGKTVLAYFVRWKDQCTIYLDGAVEDGKAVVALTESCYAQPGKFVLTIKIVDGDVRTAVFCGEGGVTRSETGSFEDDEKIIYDVPTLMAQIDAMEAATAAANEAAGSANASAAKINGMTVSAQTADTAGATITEADGVMHIAFELPKGDKGDPGSIDNVTVSSIEGLQEALDGKQPSGNYLTGESDPTVPSWAKADTKPSYTASEVGALAAEGTAADSTKLGGKTWDDLMLTIYPVGSIYMSVNSANPAALFGGTWEQIEDTFLLAAGSSYGAGSTGGEAQHALTEEEMPEHDHDMPAHLFSWGQGVDDTVYAPVSAASGTATNNYLYTLQGEWNKTGSVGGGAAHNNMPPYLAVYVWKRVS